MNSNTNRTPSQNELAPPPVTAHYSPPPKVATPLLPKDLGLLPNIPDTVQEKWFKAEPRLMEIDPDIQNSIQAIEDLTRDLQLDEDAFRVPREDLRIHRSPVQHPAYRNKTFGDKSSNFDLERHYPRTTSCERSPPTNLRQRRASVPRINVSRATFRFKPNFFTTNTDSGRAVKSPQEFLEELRSNRAPILRTDCLQFPKGRQSGDWPPSTTPDDLDIDKFLRANSKDSSAGSSKGPLLSTRSTPEGELDAIKLTPSKIRPYGPGYDDAEEMILKDIEQEFS